MEEILKTVSALTLSRGEKVPLEADRYLVNLMVVDRDFSRIRCASLVYL